MSTLLTRDELAQLFGCSVGTIRRLEKAGKIKVVRISPRVLRFRKEDVEALLAAQ